jgi:hypothetical protein
VKVNSVFSVSEAKHAHIFKVEMNSLGEILAVYRFLSPKRTGRKLGNEIGTQLKSTGTGRRKCIKRPFLGQ